MTKYQSGSIVVEANDAIYPGNLVISHSHTPGNRITIERNDRWDLLRALMEAQGCDPDVIRLVIP